MSEYKTKKNLNIHQSQCTMCSLTNVTTHNGLNIKRSPNSLHSHQNNFLQLQGLLAAGTVTRLRWAGLDWVGLDQSGLLLARCWRKKSHDQILEVLKIPAQILISLIMLLQSLRESVHDLINTTGKRWLLFMDTSSSNVTFAKFSSSIKSSFIFFHRRHQPNTMS